MKTLLKKILVPLLLALPCAAIAQIYGSVVATNTNLTTSGGIVKAWTSNESITYVESQGQGYFLYSDAFGNGKTLTLNQGISVKDFCICGGIVYACGVIHTGINTNDGVVLAFDAQDWLVNPASVNVQVHSYNQIDSLRSIAAYKIPAGSIEVITVGNGYDGATNVYSGYAVVLHFNGIIATPGTLYAMPAIPQTRVERLFSVVETDNFVALIGHQIGLENAMTIRQCKKGNIGLTIKYLYQYHIPDEPSTFVIGTRMQGDRIATASLYTDAATNSIFETRVRTFDMMSMQMQDAQAISLDTKRDPLDLIYRPTDNTLLLLQEYEHTPGIVDPCAITLKLNPPSDYATRCFYGTDIKFGSLDNIGDNHLIVSGGKLFSHEIQWFLRDMSLPLLPHNCHRVADVHVMLRNIWPKDPHQDVLPNPQQTSVYPITSSTANYNSSIICN